MFFSKTKKIVTHSGSFHADDIFACATLLLYFKKRNISCKFIRTRDQKIIQKADIVVDVGTVYNPEIDRFDHHQQGGAGKRDSGIPYASFGLVWKKYGMLLCNSKEFFDDIDKRLASPIDAIDNGISVSSPTELGIYDYGIYGAISACQSTWKDKNSNKKQDKNFLFLVNFFSQIIDNEISRVKSKFEMIDIISEIYKHSIRKDILEIPYSSDMSTLMYVLEDHKEVQLIVSKSNENWKVLALRKKNGSFENRCSMPVSWGGKRDLELQKISTVSDAIFCHNSLFMAIAKSKKGALKLAELALLEAKKNIS